MPFRNRVQAECRRRLLLKHFPSRAWAMTKPRPGRRPGARRLPCLRCLARGIVGGDGLDDAVQVIKGGELDDNLALALPEFDLDTRIERVRQPVRQLRQTW